MSAAWAESASAMRSAASERAAPSEAWALDSTTPVREVSARWVSHLQADLAEPNAAPDHHERRSNHEQTNVLSATPVALGRAPRPPTARSAGGGHLPGAARRAGFHRHGGR